MTDSQKEAVILCDIASHVATVTLNRPEQRNALSVEAYDLLEATFRDLNGNDDVRCVVLTGTDPGFCSGDDVREMMTGEKAEARNNAPPVIRHKITPAADAVLACEKPVIAAVNGAAIGWGMELTTFADIRIASEKAKFSEMFIKRGLICDVGGFYRLPSIVGPSKAAELLFTGDVIDAQEALRIGLVGEVTPHEQLMPRATEMAARIAVNPPLALRHMKEGLRRVSLGDPHKIGAWAIEKIHYLMKTEDHKEGVASFLEKRAPVFKGR